MDNTTRTTKTDGEGDPPEQKQTRLTKCNKASGYYEPY